jgi:hypothetical protein
MVTNWLQKSIDAIGNCWFQVSWMKSSFPKVSLQLLIALVLFLAYAFDLDGVGAERRQNNALTVVENRVIFHNLLGAERLLYFAGNILN